MNWSDLAVNELRASWSAIGALDRIRRMLRLIAFVVVFLLGGQLSASAGGAVGRVHAFDGAVNHARPGANVSLEASIDGSGLLRCSTRFDADPQTAVTNAGLVQRYDAPTLLRVSRSLIATKPGAGLATEADAELSGILRDAAKGKGNFGLGSSTASEAEAAGRAWVGDGAKLASDGKTLVSSDGLRQYRPPSYKPNLGKVQANFESRGVPQGQWQSNGHLDVKP